MEIAKSRLTIRAICFIGMFTAVISVLSIFQIPTPWGVPFTLQTFAIALCGYVLGMWFGTISTVLYVLIGLIGVPVFAGMSSGPGVLVGYSGGYIYGFIPMAFLCGLGMGIRLGNSWICKIVAVLFGVFGLACCHALGVVQFKYVMNMGWKESFLLASAPYLLKDVLSVVAAYAAALVLRQALAAANLMDWSRFGRNTAAENV